MTKLSASLIRDEYGNKKCTQCGEWKDESLFSAHSKSADKLQPRCKECRADNGRFESFGITRDQYSRMLNEQRNRCAICKSLSVEKGFAVDHDHSCCPGRKSCGKCIRALLCNGCNLGIGYMKEDIERMQNAIEYLRAHMSE